MKQLIKNSLVKCNITELDEIIRSDNQIKELLFTPCERLPEKYLNLIDEVFPEIKNFTLYDLIKISSQYKNTQSYFSKVGDKIVGWCAYQTSDNISTGEKFVSKIKMFSFDISKPNPVLYRDLENLIKQLLEEYNVVSWNALQKNEANRAYDMALERFSRLGYQTNKVSNGNEFCYAIFKD